MHLYVLPGCKKLVHEFRAHGYYVIYFQQVFGRQSFFENTFDHIFLTISELHHLYTVVIQCDGLYISVVSAVLTKQSTSSEQT